jgi:hypothetical protein
MRHLIWGTASFVLLLGGAAAGARAAPITLNIFTNPHSVPGIGGGTIGFAYAGDKFVGSVQADGTGNVLYQTDLNGGNAKLFAPTINIGGGSPASEHFVSSSLGLGGFPNHDIYVAVANTVLDINHAGTSASTFVTLPANDLVRGILFDAVGTFNNDMLITTNTGDIFRVNSAGKATKLASTGEDTEGLDVAPLGAGFGSFDG